MHAECAGFEANELPSDQWYCEACIASGVSRDKDLGKAKKGKRGGQAAKDGAKVKVKKVCMV